MQPTAIPNLWTYHGPLQTFFTTIRTSTSTRTRTTQRTITRLDMCLALHLCGEATDVALRLSAEFNTQLLPPKDPSLTPQTPLTPPTLIFAPCCVGKLSTSSHNPYIYQSTGTNIPQISYPQSSPFCSVIPSTHGTTTTNTSTNSTHHTGTEPNDWDALAKAADFGEMHASQSRNAARRVAKSLLEMDRSVMLRERYGYHTTLMRMEPYRQTNHRK